MNTFEQIFLKTNPPNEAPPTGTVALRIENNRLVVNNPDGTNSSVGAVISGTPVNGVKATQTLTSNGTAPANGVTVTIGEKVYTFQTTLTNVDGNVLIGISAAVALDNLKSAMNLTAGGGTTYAAATTAHPLFVATTNTDTTQVIEARNPGVWANGVTLAESSVTLQWGGSGLTTGGVDTTAAKAGDKKVDATYEYTAVIDGTAQTPAVWRRVSLGSAY